MLVYPLILFGHIYTIIDLWQILNYHRNHRKIYDRSKEEDQVLELDFGNNPDKFRGKYLEMYEKLSQSL